MEYKLIKKFLPELSNLNFKQVIGSKKHLVSENGDVISFVYKTPRLMKQSASKKGYKFICLFLNGKYKRKPVSHVVAEAFIGKRPENTVCCHLDGTKENNHYTNLAWETQKVNISHKKIHGTLKRGEDMPNTKLTNAIVVEIRKMYLAGSSISEVAKCFNVNVITLRQILNNKSWNFPEAQPSKKVEKIKSLKPKALGVSFNSGIGYWTAQTTIKRKKKHIGTFKTKEDAIEAYNNYILENGVK